MMEKRDKKVEASAFYRAVGTLEGIRKITYKSALEMLKRLQEAYGRGDPVYDLICDLTDNIRQLRPSLKKASLVQMLQGLIFKDDLKIKAENCLSLFVTNFAEDAKTHASTEIGIQKQLEDLTFRKKITVGYDIPAYLKAKVERYNKCHFQKVSKAYKAHEKQKSNRNKYRSNQKNNRNQRKGNNNSQNGNNNGNSGNNNGGNQGNRRQRQRGKKDNRGGSPQGKQSNDQKQQSNDQWAENQAKAK